jgi:uncharacterized protein (TIGR03437 family)
MKSVVFRNFAQDASMLHERLTMDMFRNLGLPYLREAHAKLYINGVYEGLFLAVEPIDTRFLTSHFGESDGYLFEFNWNGDGYHWDYLGDDPALYVPDRFEPKNHESDPQPGWIVDMLRAISRSTDADFPAAVSRYLDIDTFLAHAAVEQFMAEWDGLLGETGTTNFYLYRRRADDRAVVIVWDKEATFTNFDWSIWRNTERNAVLRRALRVPAFRKRYLDTLAETARIAGGADGWLAQESERLVEQIRSAAMEDPNRVCAIDGSYVRCDVLELQGGWEWVKGFVAQRRAFVGQELLDGQYQLPADVLHSGSACQLATGAARLTPGALVRLDLPRVDRGEKWADQFPLPAEMNGIRVRMGGRDSPLIGIDPGGILVQVPFELPCGPQSVEVTEAGTTTNAITVENRPSSPGIFAVVHGDGSPVDAKRPASALERIVLYGTGFGNPGTELATGVPAPASPLVTLKDPVRARIGGQTAAVIWAGFVAGYAGLQQIVLEVPPGVHGAAPLELIMHEEIGTPYEVLVQ